MTGLSGLVLAAAGAAAAVNWWSRARGSRRLEHVTKPTATLLLLLVLLTLDVAHPAQRWWFVGAVGLCLVGDVFLMLPREWFTAGLLAFLLAHAAFVLGFVSRGVEAGLLVLGLVAVLVAVSPAAVAIVQALRRSDAGALVGPVLAYMGAIVVMVAAALGTRSVPAVAGAAVFLVSDTLLAWNRFVRPLPWAHVGVMVTYHLGLAGLVVSAGW